MAWDYVIFSARFAPFTGGVESYTRNLADELARSGLRVAVVTAHMDASPEEERVSHGVQVVRLPAKPLMGGRFPLTVPNARQRALLRRLEREGVRRVLVNTRFYPLSVTGLRFARRVGAPAVLLDHGSMHLVMGSPALDWLIARYEHAFTFLVKCYRPRFAGVSAKSVEWLRHFGIESKLVLQNAIDAPAFRLESSGRDFRAELNVPAHAMLVCFVGRLAPEKGPEVLVQAAHLLEDAGVYVVLAGRGPLQTELESQAGGNVSFVGNLRHDDLSALLQASDVFCLPTRSEGFCTSLLEASACGLPAVIPDVGGARELIPNASAGVIVNSADAETVARALRGLLQAGSQVRWQMGCRAREVVERDHGWPQTAQALNRAYDGCPPAPAGDAVPEEMVS